MIPVLWFLGLSGSGKTTLTKDLFKYLQNNSEFFPHIKKWEILDGDVIRSFFDNDLGYDISDRRKSVRFMGLLAKMLSKNEVGVIVANISPFEDLRQKFRKEIPGYVQIYCNADLQTCMSRDPKNLYKKQINEGLKNYIGLDIPFDPTENNDLVLNTQNLKIETCFDQLLLFCNKLKEEYQK